MATMLRHTAALIAALLVIAPVARAQGVPDPRTGIDYPMAQSAAVEDATALLVNPAGLAMLEGTEVNLGGFLRTNANQSQTDLDATLAIDPGDIGFALGAGLTVPSGGVALLRTSAGLAVGDGRVF